ncbi:MAG TPA: sigma factor-like helix-turn-helix DNA-binding protein [Mycobacterium sp.]
MTAEAETGRLKGFDASRADEPEQLFDRALISEAFARLHRSHREVIYRAYYLRWTTGQIAADLNVTEPVVKRRLHDALRTLRFALNDRHRIGDECVRSPRSRDEEGGWPSRSGAAFGR